jgi:hypothetical protein
MVRLTLSLRFTMISSHFVRRHYDEHYNALSTWPAGFSRVQAGALWCVVVCAGAPPLRGLARAVSIVDVTRTMTIVVGLFLIASGGRNTMTIVMARLLCLIRF